jgi:hypothetical protein
LRKQKPRVVPIFATDIDADLVAAARVGRFSGEIGQQWFFRRSDVVIRPPEFPLPDRPTPREPPHALASRGVSSVQPASLGQALERMFEDLRGGC